MATGSHCMVQCRASRRVAVEYEVRLWPQHWATLRSSTTVQGILMKILHKIFPIGHFVISVLFIGCALALIGCAGFQLWQGIQPISTFSLPQRLNAILESIALLTVAVAALELG